MTDTLFAQTMKTVLYVKQCEKDVAKALGLILDGSTPSFRGLNEQVIVDLLADYFGEGSRQLIEFFIYENQNKLMTIEELWDKLIKL